MVNLSLHPQSARVYIIVIGRSWYSDAGETVRRISRPPAARSHCGAPPPRAQARACRGDLRRWKRRRYVQRLRQRLSRTS